MVVSCRQRLGLQLVEVLCTPRPIRVSPQFPLPIRLGLAPGCQLPHVLPSWAFKNLQCRTSDQTSLRGWNILHRVDLRLSANFSTAFVHPTHARNRLGKHCSQLPSFTPSPWPFHRSSSILATKTSDGFASMCLQIPLYSAVYSIPDTAISQRA
jgi:hypothetical protein